MKTGATCATGRLLLLLLLLFSIDSCLFGLVYNYTDSFNTTEFMDFSLSTGSWDAEQGQLRLSVETHTMPNLISRNIGNINAITFVNTENNGLAVGERGLLMTWESGTSEWRVNYYSQQQHNLNDISLYGNAGGYAVGENGFILKIDSVAGPVDWTWSSVGGGGAGNPTTKLNGVDSKTATQTWIVGDGGGIWHYNGTGGFTLNNVPASFTRNLNAVVMTEELDAALVGTGTYWGYAIGDNGSVLTTENSGTTAWIRDATFPSTANMNDVFVGSVGLDSHVWVVGDGGLIYFYSGGGTWTQQAVGLTSENLKSIHFFHPDPVNPSLWAGFVVGDKGTILLYQDTNNWTVVTPASHQDLNAVYTLDVASPTCWVVGEDTIFAKYDAAAAPNVWDLGQLDITENPNYPFITGSDVNDIDFFSNANGFFVGEDGSSFRYDGANWVYITTTPFVDGLYAVSAYGLNQAYAVGEIDNTDFVNTSLFRFDSISLQWVNMTYPGTPAILRDVHVVNGSAGLAVGDGRALIELTGLATWSVPTTVPAVPPASFTNLYGVWSFHNGTDYSGSVIVGSRTGGGAIATLNAGAGAWSPTSTTRTMRSVSMVGKDFGVAVGDSGEIYVFNGTAWTSASASVGLTNNLTNVYAVSTQEIYITDSIGNMYMYQYDPAGNSLKNQKIRTDPGNIVLATVELKSTGIPKQPLTTDTRLVDIHFVGAEGTIWSKPEENYAGNGYLNTISSKKVNSATQINIYSIEVTATDDANNGNAIVYSASNNGGTTWTPITLGNATPFASYGSDLRFKAELSTNALNATDSPFVSDISMTFETDQLPPTDPNALTHTDIGAPIALNVANVSPIPIDNDTDMFFSWSASYDSDTFNSHDPAGYKIQIMTTDVNVAGTSSWSPVFTVATTDIFPPANTIHGFTLDATAATWGAWRTQNNTGYYLSVAAYDGFDQTSGAVTAVDYVRCDLTAPNVPGNFIHNENPGLPGRSSTIDYTADNKIGYTWSSATDNWPNNINYYYMKIDEYNSTTGLVVSSNTRVIASNETGFTLEPPAFNVVEGVYFSVELVAVDNAFFTSAAVMTVPVIADFSGPTVPGDPTHSDGTEHNSIVANVGWDDDASLNWTWTASTDTVSGVSYEVSLYSYHPTNGLTLISSSIANNNIFTYTPDTNELTYEITVIAIDGAGNRTAALLTAPVVTVDQTPPSSPTALTAQQDTDSSGDGFNPRPGYNDDGAIVWDWTETIPRDNLAFRFYTIEQSIDGGATYPASNTTANATYTGAWIDTNKVTLRLYGTDACGLTSAAWAVPITGITVDTTAPIWPGGSICQGNDSDPVSKNWDNDINVDFSWTAATDATSFIDFYRVQVHSYEASVGWHHDAVSFTQAGNTYTHTLGVDDIGYRLSIEAIDYAGNLSLQIPTSSVVTVETTAVGDVTNVWHTDEANSPYDSGLSLAFTWEAPATSTNIAYYNVYVSANDGTTYQAAPTFTVATTYCTIEAAAPANIAVATGDFYNINVQAISTVGIAGNSVEGSADLYTPNVPVRVDDVAPFQPVVTHSDTTAITGYDDDTSLEFAWTPVAPDNDTPVAVDWFDRYDIYVRTNGVAWVYKTQQSTNSYTATGQNGFSYEVAIVPYDGAGNRGQTGEAGPIHVITDPPPIPDQPKHYDADAPAGYDNDYFLRFNWTTPPDGTIKWVNIYSGDNGPVDTSMTVATFPPSQIATALGFTLPVGAAANGHEYGIRVEYVNFLDISSGISMTSTPYPIEVVIGAPDQPDQPVLSEEVLNSPYCGNQIRFAWKRKVNNDKLLEYRVYITQEGVAHGPFSVNTLKPVGSWHSYTYTDSSIADDQTVTAAISAVGLAGSESVLSTWSSNAIVDLNNPMPDPVITAFTNDPIDAPSISVELSTLSSDSHLPIIYQVQGTAYSTWTQMAGPPFLIPLSQNQTNIIRIRPIDAAGRIGNYVEAQIVEDSVGPGTPGKPTHVDDAPAPWENDTNIEIKWNAPTQGDVSVYKIEVSANDGSFVDAGVGVTTEYFTYTIPTSETNFYRFRVRAFDNLGRSSSSEISDYIYVDTDAPRPDPVINFALYSVDWRTGYHTVHSRYFTVELSTITTTDGNGFKYQIKGGLIGDWLDTVPADGTGGNKFVFPLVAETLNSLEIRAIDPAQNTTNYDPNLNTNFRLYVMEKSTPPPQPSEPKHVDSNANPGFDNDTTLVFDWDDLSLESDIVSSYLVYVSVNSGNYFQYSEVLTHEVTITGTEGNYYRIKTKSKDLYGNTGDFSPHSNNILIDMTPAKVMKSSIADGERFVATSTYIEINFDEDMDQDSLLNRGNVTLVGPNNIQVDGKVEYSMLTRKLTFTPYEDLGHDKDYRFVLSTNVKDAAGNNLTQAIVISFHTLPPEGLKIMRLLNYPNPITTTGTSFAYYLSQDSDEVVIQVFGLDGKRLLKLEGCPTWEGYNEIFWDGIDKDGFALSNGTYLVKAVVMKDGKSDAVVSKVVVLK